MLPSVADAETVAFRAVDPPNPAEEIHRRSGGNVVAIPPSGPVLARRWRHPLQPTTFEPVLERRERLLVAALTVGWFGCLVWFWVWLLQPAHRAGWLGLALNGLVLLYLSGMPIYFMIGVNRLRRVRPDLPLPNLRVAFVVTKAPSEPWAVAGRTLCAMLAQDYPRRYDVWLCDESPTDEVRDWCARHGVRISTRAGVTAYHRSTWPRRTRCKEGNLAYFYDRVGYRDYDVVAQLDCDHVPAPGYLAAMVRPFIDRAVGYVAAPSVCDTNTEQSWSARGRLHREATFHGPAQLGHSAGLAPVCIGSHYAVRTAALAQIGGIGPELAEDFSTTFLLNSGGWEGAFAIDAEARGDGPPTFSAMLVQEFQWSRSLTTVLLGLVPRHLPRLPWRLRIRFLYALLYYPLIALTTVGGLALAPIAAVTGAPWIQVNYVEFLLHWWAISIWIVAITVLLRRRGLLRPPDAPILSWENYLYCLSRWPLIGWGVCAALLQAIRPRQITFRVTPKGPGGLEPFPLRLVAPYALVSLVMSGAALWGETHTRAAGYVFLCLLAAVSYAVVALALPLLHARESARAARVRFGTAVGTVRPALATALTVAIAAGIAAANYPAYAIWAFGW